MKIAFIAAAAAVFVSVPAYAQDDANFSGVHAEVIAGYDSVKTGVIGKPDGVLYGFNLGYDFQTGGAVFGVEAEAADSSAGRNIGGAKVEAARDLYAGGRIGAAIGSQALIYAKAGYTNFRVEAAGVGGNLDGFRAGAGIEYKLGGKLLLKGEYRYSNYEGGVERHQLVAGLGWRF
jgi:outer membrane immunogenic protein